MSEEKLRLQKILTGLAVWVRKARRYSLPIFLVFVALLYGIVLFRIHGLSTAQPTPDQVTSQVQAARPLRIDQSVVQQLQTLQDNSVSVQGLFNQARNNPFQ